MLGPERKQLLLMTDVFALRQQLARASHLRDSMLRQVHETLLVAEMLEEQKARLLDVVQTVTNHNARGKPTAAAQQLLGLLEAENSPRAQGSPVEHPAQSIASNLGGSASSSLTASGGSLVQSELHSGHGPGGITTLMIRPIPRGGSHDMLFGLWSPTCRECPYNMLYAPKRPKRRGLQGYAYINFTSSDAATRFRARWEGVLPQPCGDVEWTGPLSIAVSDFQGLDMNLNYYDEHKLDAFPEDRWPAIFKDGALLDFRAVMADFRDRVARGFCEAREKLVSVCISPQQRLRPPPGL
jgi:hypothetical protein